MLTCFFRRACRVVAALTLLSAAALAAAATPGVYLEEMTSPEVQAAVQTGATTVLVPIGGTEQNGPHMVLGKHNMRVHVLAGQIAQRLGHTLVAPVMAYVPEGTITPPQAHMRFAGTLSVPEATFESLLDATARSLKQHGFRDIVFLGDHGGYQKNMAHVADRLDREWSADLRCRVHALHTYYDVTQTSYVQALKQRGFSLAEIGTHAGLADTSLALAIDPALVRIDQLGQPLRGDDGVAGDPRRATALLGQLGVREIVDTSAAAIRALLVHR